MKKNFFIIKLYILIEIKMEFIIITESIIFSLIMIIFSFLITYIGDVIQILLGKIKIINWFPQHSISMIIGIFFTSVVVYLLFSNAFIKYKLS